MRTRVKICGITRIEDAQAAAHAGADAIGLVFDDRSPRFVSGEMAAAIVASLPPFVNVVGLFVDAAAERIHAVLSRVPLDLLQFHGAEAPEACRAFGRPYIKAVRMAPEVDVTAAARRYGDAAGILLDSYSPKVAGGSGETFDWSRVPRDLGRPLILAGGLTPDNVARAIAVVRPYAVDVSSGVERAKGVKDRARIEAFVRAVAAA
ncbi:MAG TPA: phosphoribosylanthranilate isomerase [Acidiferrobacterales bacterium]|jgi:phosphoribosylanthranilate isomerase